MADRPLLLLIDTGMHHYREYLLRSIAGSHRLHLFVSAEPTWEREYTSDYTVVDTHDGPEMAAAARRLTATNPVDGVLCWDEAKVYAAAQVARALGLPGGDPDAVLRCRDKHRTRTALAAAGVAQPRSRAVGTVDEALAFATEVGYPVVVKPRGFGASFGVVRADDPDELAVRFGDTLNLVMPDVPYYDTILVEEFVDGPEISVDSAVHRGRVTPMFVARKEVGYPPYFEEIGHRVVATDPLLRDPELTGILQQTHHALGYPDGVTHTELKLTPAGPKVIEVNARLGGDLIPYLGLLATGIDPGRAAADVACGRPPVLAADRSLVGAVRFYYVDRDDTTIESVGFAAAELPPAIRDAVPLVLPGAVVSPPPKGTVLGRVGYSVAVAHTAAECTAALDAAQAALRVVGTTMDTSADAPVPT